jgi:hypothetical protein
LWEHHEKREFERFKTLSMVINGPPDKKSKKKEDRGIYSPTPEELARMTPEEKKGAEQRQMDEMRALFSDTTPQVKKSW